MLQKKRLMNRNNKEFLAAYVSQRMDMGESEWFLDPAGVFAAIGETVPKEALQGGIERVAEAKKPIQEVPQPDSVSEEAIASAKTLDELSEAVSGCKRCELGLTRNKFVFGAGNPKAGILFVGEAPGADEDAQGIPFVGRSGKLLTKMIEALKLSRDEVYIANILKCRPPGNRNPKAGEIDLCEKVLLRQIDIIKPKVICALGLVSGQTLLRTKSSLGELRKTMHDYHGVKFIVTYHPAALLRNPNWKQGAWEDLKKARQEFDGLEL